MMDYSSTLPYESEAVPGVKFEVFKPSNARNIEFNRMNAAFREEAKGLRSQMDRVERQIEEHARTWNRENEARYRAAKTSPEKEESQAVIRGYEAAREMETLRTELGQMDLKALAELSDDDERVKDATAKLERIQSLSEIATLYNEPVELLEERNWHRRSSAILMEEKYRPVRVRWGVKSISGMTINGQPITVENLLADGPPDLTAEVFERIEEVSRFDAEKLKKSSLPTTSNAVEVGSESNTTATPASEANSTSPATAPSISLG